VGARAMLATTFAANALSVSVVRYLREHAPAGQ
jgi:hypothetical protein